MRVLVFRLSSLGDLILSTAYLENLDPQVRVDWVVAKEFAFVLEGHPKIENLIIFDKKTGLRGWIKLLQKLSLNRYDWVIDLHRTLRTQIARFYLRHTPWKKISKERVRSIGFLVFKKTWPRRFFPTPYWQRFAQIAKPAATILHPPRYPFTNHSNPQILEKYGLSSKKYFAIAPASRWASKEWGVQNYLNLCQSLKQSLKQNLNQPLLLLGRTTDRACRELAEALKQNKITYASALEEPNFKNTATLLEHATAYIGADTGLAHLAEAVGTRAIVIFGPTRPELGFGPWKNESRAVFTQDISCSPCSKDGRLCYRFFDPYACFKKIKTTEIMRAIST